MDEFALIKTHFAPLAKNFSGALNLADDAAVIAPPPGHELVVTKDAISAGVHFTDNEPPGLIAQKLLRVNLSDLAAMGATPLCYFLALILPSSLSFSGLTRESIPMDPRLKAEDDRTKWIAAFAAGLAGDQETFGIALAGGDTTATKGKLALSLTALGTLPAGSALKRSGAKPGDQIFVSGTLGDAALGLESNDAFLKRRYRLPEPRVALGQRLRGIASACMDISDGLAQDLGHICEASGIGAVIHRPLLPLSDAAKQHPLAHDAALSGGDDYELLFTAPPEKENTVAALAKELNLPLTRIGEMVSGKEVAVLDEAGKPLKVKPGYRHF